MWTVEEIYTDGLKGTSEYTKWAAQYLIDAGKEKDPVINLSNLLLKSLPRTMLGDLEEAQYLELDGLRLGRGGKYYPGPELDNIKFPPKVEARTVRPASASNAQ